MKSASAIKLLCRAFLLAPMILWAQDPHPQFFDPHEDLDPKEWDSLFEEMENENREAQEAEQEESEASHQWEEEKLDNIGP